MSLSRSSFSIAFPALAHRLLPFLMAWALFLPVSHAQLPHNIPDFSTDTSRPNVRSVQSGDWSNASTWAGGQVPTASHVVNIDPGHTVTISNTSATAYTVAIHGTLRFSTTANTRLRVTNLVVMGDHGMPSMTHVGHLEVGTSANPVSANV